MLNVEGLTLHYGGSQILNGIDMSAQKGQVTCVMGTNGVGKTSLLQGDLWHPWRSGGRLTFDGQEISKLPAHQLARRGVGYVPQGRDIFPLMTVQENLETGFACLPREERQISDEIFELFPILQGLPASQGRRSVGGQQQQLAIARALIAKPKLLLLDEPTEGIQPNIIQQIGRVISLLRQKGDMAIVLVEQYFDFAYDLGDRFFVLERGANKLSGAKDEVDKTLLLESVSVR